MGDRSRERTEAVGLLDLEARGEAGELGDEMVPAHVRLGSGQDDDRPARRVGRSVELYLRPSQLGVDPVDDAHDGPSRPVVDQLVGVEARHELRGHGRDQVRHGVVRREAGVDPPVEAHDEHRPLDGRPAVDADQLGRAHLPDPRLSPRRRSCLSSLHLGPIMADPAPFQRPSSSTACLPDAASEAIVSG